MLAKMSVYLKVAMHPLFTFSNMSIRREILGYKDNEYLLHPLFDLVLET